MRDRTALTPLDQPDSTSRANGASRWDTRQVSLAQNELVALLILPPEACCFLRADLVWLITSDGGQACAKVNVTPSGARKPTSVATWPFKRQLSTVLVGELLPRR